MCDPCYLVEQLTQIRESHIASTVPFIGLSYDDRFFGGWYKKHHPHGRIIAIDLQKPSYLEDDDYLVRGLAGDYFIDRNPPIS